MFDFMDPSTVAIDVYGHIWSFGTFFLRCAFVPNVFCEELIAFHKFNKPLDNLYLPCIEVKTLTHSP